jgi:hypothetical protein
LIPKADRRVPSTSKRIVGERGAAYNITDDERSAFRPC